MRELKHTAQPLLRTTSRHGNDDDAARGGDENGGSSSKIYCTVYVYSVLNVLDRN